MARYPVAVPAVRIDPNFEHDARKLLKAHPAKAAKVRKTLDQLATDPRYPSLATKKYDDTLNIWQSYVENNTPGAWRVWWMWDPTQTDMIVIIGFGPHP